MGMPSPNSMSLPLFPHARLEFEPGRWCETAISQWQRGGFMKCHCLTTALARTCGIIQICHASVGILMECLPSGRWFSRGRSPRENHLPEGRHSIRIPTLAWYILFIIPNKPHFGEITIKTTIDLYRNKTI